MNDRPIEAATLHQQIMNLPATRAAKANSSYLDMESAYKAGHRDARHAAAELVLASAPIEAAQTSADTKRLDWLQADMQRGDDGVCIHFDGARFAFPYQVSGAGGFGGGVGEFGASNLREAIDAAMGASAPPAAATKRTTYTFDQLVEHGRKSGCELYGDKRMPWSFSVEGHPVTHENDECYIICGPNHRAPEYGHFVPGDLLVIEDGIARIERAPAAATVPTIPVLNALEVLDRMKLPATASLDAAEFLRLLGKASLWVIDSPFAAPAAATVEVPASSLGWDVWAAFTRAQDLIAAIAQGGCDAPQIAAHSAAAELREVRAALSTPPAAAVEAGPTADERAAARASAIEAHAAIGRHISTPTAQKAELAPEPPEERRARLKGALADVFGWKAEGGEVPAEAKLTAAGVYKGADGLRRLAECQEFWDKQPYGTRLYFEDSGTGYLHRGVLRAAVELLDARPTPAAAAGVPPGYVLATFKPTPQMIDAGQAAARFGVAQVWREMLAASGAPQTATSNKGGA